jgi:hypothetical protein
MVGHIIIIRFWRNTRPRFRLGDDDDRLAIVVYLKLACKMVEIRENATGLSPWTE